MSQEYGDKVSRLTQRLDHSEVPAASEVGGTSVPKEVQDSADLEDDSSVVTVLAEGSPTAADDEPREGLLA